MKVKINKANIMENTHNSLNAQNIEAYCAPENNIDPLGDGISSVELVRVSGSDLDIVNAEFTQKFKDSIAQSVQTYEYLLENGVGREIARSVLPLCTYTEFIFTCNLHSLMHFLKLRLHAGAQYEIRMYAQTLLKLALPHFPISLGEWKRIHAVELEIEEDLFTKNFTNTAE